MLRKVRLRPFCWPYNGIQNFDSVKEISHTIAMQCRFCFRWWQDWIICRSTSMVSAPLMTVNTCAHWSKWQASVLAKVKGWRRRRRRILRPSPNHTILSPTCIKYVLLALFRIVSPICGTPVEQNAEITRKIPSYPEQVITEASMNENTLAFTPTHTPKRTQKWPRRMTYQLHWVSKKLNTLRSG